jgi:hypothetical protein
MRFSDGEDSESSTRSRWLSARCATRVAACALVGMTMVVPLGARATDCNGNGVPDVLDLQRGTSADCNHNGVPDECDVPRVTLALTPGVTLPFLAEGPLVAGDFDADGDLDVIATITATGLALLANFGDGTFAAPVMISSLVGDPLFATDADATTALDVVGLGAIDPTAVILPVLPGQGLGTAVSITLPKVPTDTAGTDWNGDSRLDLILAGLTADALSVYSRTPQGDFAPAADVPLPGGAFALAAADLDDDGHADLVVQPAPPLAGVVVLWGAGDGTICATTQLPGSAALGVGWLTVGDVDGDHDVDVVVSTANASAATAEVFENVGKRVFAEPLPIPLGSAGGRVTIADLDGDHRPDLIVPTFFWIAVVRGLDGHSFSQPVRYGVKATSIAAADVDGDNRLDLIGLAFDEPLTVLRNVGNGTLAAPIVLAEAGITRHALGDFDRDGDLDVAVASDHEVVLYRNDGQGLFTTLGRSQVGDGVVALAIGDLNGDGFPEVVTANRSSNDLSILPNLGGVAFGAAQRVDVFTDPSDVVIGDFTGDGRTDLAVARLDSRGIVIVEGESDGTFVPVSNLPLGAFPNGLKAQDVDGNGSLDLVTRTNPVRVLLNDGRGHFAFAPDVKFAVIGDQPVDDLTIADLNGDGARDLVAVTMGSIMTANGRGDGTFSTPVSIATDAFNSQLAVGDMDGDGDADLILTRAAFDSRLEVFPNRGDGTFATPVMWALNSPTALVVADIDMDGRPDISLSDSDDGVLLIRNLSTESADRDCSNDGIPDQCQLDTDADRTPDVCDRCPLDPLKVGPETCGCGIPDVPLDGGRVRCGLCAGDCNGDGQVTISELVVSVQIALGSAAESSCRSIDVSGDGVASVDELVAAVHAALDGCPRDINASTRLE